MCAMHIAVLHHSDASSFDGQLQLWKVRHSLPYLLLVTIRMMMMLNLTPPFRAPSPPSLSLSLSLSLSVELLAARSTVSMAGNLLLL